MTTITLEEIADGLRSQLKMACQAARQEAAVADKALRAHAAALEANNAFSEKLDQLDKGWAVQHAFQRNAKELAQSQLAAREEELAERKEGFARMEFAIQQLEQQCNEARTRAESAERERDEARRDAERLRGTLEIFHSHGYDREVCGAAIAEGK